VIDSSLADLLKSAGANPRDPLIFLDIEATQSVLLPAWPETTHGPISSSYTAWFPLAPAVLLAPLPEERRRVYCRRFAERTRMDGWLIQPNEPINPSMEWCVEQIRETHIVGQTSYQNAKWQVRWVEYNSPVHLAPRTQESPGDLDFRGR
jgi:hypothetical protein